MVNITAIIPAYNEESTIGSMVIVSKNYVERVIVIDDGSIDRTSEIAEIAGAKVIKHPENLGKGAALRTGFSQIGDTDIIITLDGDGQHNPAEIPKIVSPIINGEADIVIGSRYLENKNRDTPAYRRLGQNILDTATQLNTGLKITDSQSGFRAFATYTLPAFQFNQDGFSIESAMLVDAANHGSRVKEVSTGVNYDNRNNMHKKNPVSHGLDVFLYIIQDMEFNRPLIYFTIPGLVLIAIGLILGSIFLNAYLAHLSTTLLPTVMAALIGLAGLFVAFTGIILHSLSRMLERKIAK